jgi:hypothetical protein
MAESRYDVISKFKILVPLFLVLPAKREEKGEPAQPETNK